MISVSLNNKLLFNPITNNINQAKIIQNKSDTVSFKGIQINGKENGTKQDYFDGCMIGAAIGDSWGAKVEFMPLSKIKEVYGENGLKYIPKTNNKYQVTDDTQMSLFTAEGLLKSYNRNLSIDKEPDYKDIYNSYRNWYLTQTKSPDQIKNPKGLMANRSLYVKRGPGRTCMSALDKNIIGTITNPINNSPANGGLMRVYPVGLMYNENPKLAFKVGMNCAALTHGNPDAYLPAGFLSSLVAQIVNKVPIENAIENSKNILKEYNNHDNTLKLVEKAQKAANDIILPEEAIFQMGKGGRADEALAISLYCVLKSPNNFKKAVSMAVNHDGDSDSTGAITGSIMGAKLGIKAIPRNLVENIEYLDWLTRFSRNLHIDNHKKEIAKKMIEANHQIYECRNEDRYTIV